MQIAVRGGGIYGCVIAEHLQEAGHVVTVHELPGHEILKGATSNNFRRVHKGYHYPKSLATALDCKAAFDLFTDRYGFACHPMGTVYWIARDSQVNRDEYRNFLVATGLPFSTFIPHTEELTAGFSVVEAVYSPNALRHYFDTLLRVKEEPTPEGVFTIDCTYADSPIAKEVREVTMLDLVGCRGDVAQTVLYGPFCGFMPVSHRTVRFYHAGTNDPDEMMKDARRFYPGIEDAKVTDIHRVRHTTEGKDHRPYWIECHPGGINVLSGKVAQSIMCAREIAERLR